jgi:hypothetical protein
MIDYIHSLLVLVGNVLLDDDDDDDENAQTRTHRHFEARFVFLLYSPFSGNESIPADQGHLLSRKMEDRSFRERSLFGCFCLAENMERCRRRLSIN